MKWNKVIGESEYYARTKEYTLRTWSWKGVIGSGWTWLVANNRDGLRVASGNTRRLKDAKYLAEAMLKARKRL